MLRSRGEFTLAAGPPGHHSDKRGITHVRFPVYSVKMLHRLMIVLALAAAACAWSVSTASASTAYPGQRPADARTQSLVSIALDFWAKRGVVGCDAGVRAWTAADLMDVDVANQFMVPFGRGAACEIWLLRFQVREYRRYTRPKRAGAADECATVVHEVRHALPGGADGGIDGRGHTETGVMAVSDVEVPGVCRVWARKVTRRARR